VDDDLLRYAWGHSLDLTGRCSRNRQQAEWVLQRGSSLPAVGKESVLSITCYTSTIQVLEVDVFIAMLCSACQTIFATEIEGSPSCREVKAQSTK
jgi:hypothetical protein